MERMSTARPIVLSLAGFDPSAGAGVLADIKTFENHKVYGLSVITGNTIQTENRFLKMDWMSTEWVLESLSFLAQQYQVEAVKIGIIPSLETLDLYMNTIRKHWPESKIVWDPVLKATADFEFLKLQPELLHPILSKIDLITPNHKELEALVSTDSSNEDKAKILAEHTAVLWKGGHNTHQLGTDVLFYKGEQHIFNPQVEKVNPKHGSGCILSSAITSQLALDNDLVTSCKLAKDFIEQTLNTNPTLLAYYVT